MKHFLSLVLFFASTVFAKDNTTITIPTGPGGSYHKVALELAPVLSKILNETVIVESKPGANGLVAARHVADNKSSNIGFLLGNVSTNNSVNQLTELKPVLDLGLLPNLIIAKSDLGVKSLRDLVNNPPKTDISYGVPNGSAHIFYMQEFSKLVKNKINLQEILYKSGGNVVVDVAGGHLDVGVSGVPAFVPFADNPRVKVLAVLSDKRSKLFPDVPTVHEENVKFKNDFMGFTQVVVWASPGIDAELVTKIQEGVAQWFKTTEGKQFLDKVDLSPTPKNLANPDIAIRKILGQ